MGREEERRGGEEKQRRPADLFRHTHTHEHTLLHLAPIHKHLCPLTLLWSLGTDPYRCHCVIMSLSGEAAQGSNIHTAKQQLFFVLDRSTSSFISCSSAGRCQPGYSSENTCDYGFLQMGFNKSGQKKKLFIGWIKVPKPDTVSHCTGTCYVGLLCWKHLDVKPNKQTPLDTLHRKLNLYLGH